MKAKFSALCLSFPLFVFVQEIVFIFLIKGKYDLFIVSAAIKEKELPEGFIKEWTEVFKNSKLHN